MKTPYYVLDEQGEPRQASGVLTWGRWMEEAQARDGQRVACDDIGDVKVSTVFLGLDHAFCWDGTGSGPPVLWETRIFGGEHNDYQERYTSRADALAGHARAVALARGGRGE